MSTKNQINDKAGFEQIAPCPVIDAHVHTFPDPILRAIWAWFDEYTWQARYQLPADELAGYQLKRGLAGQVLLSYAHKPGVARDLNRHLADMVEANPLSLGLAAVHPHDDDPAGVLAEAWKNPGLVGAKMHLHVLGMPMDDPAFYPIYAACADEGRLINIHVGRQPESPGYGLDVTQICGSERTEKVLREFPGLRLIVPHLGWDEADRYFILLEKYPELVMDTTMVLAGYFKDAPVDLKLLEQYSHRVMYGSDFPNIPYEHTQEVRHILSLGLSDESTEDILWRTADRVFGLGLDRLDSGQ
jgi:predicted TIM-barrel fold metal-dependent hydrolase